MNDTRSWNKLDVQMPQVRACYAIATLNNKAYIIGGCDAGYNLPGSTFIFDFDTEQWETGASMPTPRVAPACAVVNSKIYVIGGTQFNTSSIAYVEAYEPITDTWETKANMPVKVSLSSAAAVGTKIYVCGGSNWDNYATNIGGSNSLYVYDTVTDEWKQKSDMLEGATATGSMYHYNGSLYYFGAGTSKGGGTFNYTMKHACQRYIIAEDRWELFAQMPQNRVHVSVVGNDSKVFVIGGRTTTSHVTTVQQYDILTDHWSELDSIPANHDDGAAVCYKGKIYAFGCAHTNNIYVYDLDDRALRILLHVDETVQLKGILLPSGVETDDVIWSSADAAIASVDADGLTLGVSPGLTRITVTANDGTWSDSVLVQVVEAGRDPEYRLCIRLTEGETCRLIASNDPTEVFSWTSSSPVTATVSNTGLVTAVSTGITLITVTSLDGQFTDEIHVKVISA